MPLAQNDADALELLGPIRSATGRPIIVFDGDDTLWETEPLYDVARSLAAQLVEDVGLDSKEWDAKERQIDVANVARLGLSAARFPQSCVEAYEELCRERSIEPEAAVSARVRDAAESVFRARAPLFPGAASALAELHTRFPLYLLTQGDPAVQRKRVADSGLQHHFDGAFLTPLKSQSVLSSLLHRLNTRAEQCIFVGNSVASDINPALSVGMRAVWIDAHVWDHERRESLHHRNGLAIAESLIDLPAALEELGVARIG